MFKNYDPADIIATFLGSLIIGFAEGTFVRVERNEDSFTLKVGSQGDATRSRNRNKSGTITFTLMQSSPSNDVLSNAALADELDGSGIGVAQVKDLNGTSLALGATAWVRKRPAGEWGKEAGNREWVLETDNLEHFVGGALT